MSGEKAGAPDRRPRRGEPPRLPTVVLASASPRRRELLAALGLTFAVRPVDLDETPRPGEAPRAYVARLAVEKALAADSHHGELVLAADTVVVLPGEGEGGGPALLGKPADAAEAEAMLARLAGREHRVLTGVALVGGGGAEGDAGRPEAAIGVAIEESRVRIGPLSADEIAWYVATGEPLDKAGAYAIQGIGALFVAAVEGNYTNVVGLPLPAVYRLFAERGYDLRRFLAAPGAAADGGPAPRARSMPRSVPDGSPSAPTR